MTLLAVIEAIWALVGVDGECAASSDGGGNLASHNLNPSDGLLEDRAAQIGQYLLCTSACRVNEGATDNIAVETVRQPSLVSSSPWLIAVVDGNKAGMACMRDENIALNSKIA